MSQDDYSVNITKVRDDKMRIEVKFRQANVREFTVFADKDGLKITADGVMVITPIASNAIRVDYA